ncbi:MAG: hypothetical protein WCF06_08405 [Nitrososphaeraceae archaeon]
MTEEQELLYSSWFYQNVVYNPYAITQADVDEYVGHYSTLGGMRLGFEYCRAFTQCNT